MLSHDIAVKGELSAFYHDFSRGRSPIGATQGTLRYDPISRLRPPDDFRFQYWPWQFPDKIDYSAAFFNALRAENFRFYPFWEIAWE
jgi:hypothetical protein